MMTNEKLGKICIYMNMYSFCSFLIQKFCQIFDKEVTDAASLFKGVFTIYAVPNWTKSNICIIMG